LSTYWAASQAKEEETQGGEDYRIGKAVVTWKTVQDMYGNRDLNKEKNSRALAGFLLLYVFSLALAGFVAYQYAKVPKLENSLLRAQLAELQEEQRLFAQMNTNMDSIVVLVKSRKDPVPITNARISQIYLAMEGEAQRTKANEKAYLEVVKNLVDTRVRLQKLADVDQRRLDAEREREKAERDKEKLESDLSSCRSQLMAIQTMNRAAPQ
jgi:hypothetical protein